MEQQNNQFNSSQTNPINLTPAPINPKKEKSKLILLISAIALTAVIVGGGMYWWMSSKQDDLYKKVVDSQNQGIQSENTLESQTSLPTTCVNQPYGSDHVPVITSISPSSGPIGTKIKIDGCDLYGFEGDFNVVLVRSDGVEVLLDDGRMNSNTITVQSYCTDGFTIGAYSGIASKCETIEATPGVYKVYIKPWGVKSNVSNFTITGNYLAIPDTPALFFSSTSFVQLTWNYDAADYFNIYRSVNLGGPWEKIISNHPQNAHAAVDYAYPKNAKILYYRISSIDGNGNESELSKVSAINIQTNKPVDIVNIINQ